MSLNQSDNKTSLDLSRITTNELIKRLNVNKWPFKLENLPLGSALVGGAIRDSLFGLIQEKPDLDFIVPHNAYETAKSLSDFYGGRCVLLDKKRDIARLVIDKWSIDFAKQVGSTIEEDLKKRDFTINSIALLVSKYPQIFDPNQGIEHIKLKKLVIISEENIIKDPLRILRGLRLISQHNLSFDIDTMQTFQKHTQLLRNSAPERIKSEIQKFVIGPWAHKIMPILKEMDLLSPWSNKSKVFISHNGNPEALHNFSQLELKLALPISRLVNLLSDEGLIALNFSKKEINLCKTLRKWQSKNDGIGYKTLNETDLLKLHLELKSHLPALILDLSKDNQKVWLKRWRDQNDPLFHPSSPLNGIELKKILNIQDGPIIGEIIYELCKEKAFSRLHTYQDAVELARNLWKQKQPLL